MISKLTINPIQLQKQLADVIDDTVKDQADRMGILAETLCQNIDLKLIWITGGKLQVVIFLRYLMRCYL